MSARLTPLELRTRIARGDDLQLVDVREPREWAIGHLPGSVLIPRGELAGRCAELDPARPVVCICHHGVRSLHAAALLSARGFAHVFDLAGGLERWALEADPTFPRYG
ncbi:MAG: rhodanese-like domain-containing protein [Planctomycetota bacterium]|nr:rhodanese-like domain-containing protein [Planctomycetota bacterium]